MSSDWINSFECAEKHSNSGWLKSWMQEYTWPLWSCLPDIYSTSTWITVGWTAVRRFWLDSDWLNIVQERAARTGWNALSWSSWWSTLNLIGWKGFWNKYTGFLLAEIPVVDQLILFLRGLIVEFPIVFTWSSSAWSLDISSEWCKAWISPSYSSSFSLQKEWH